VITQTIAVNLLAANEAVRL